MASFNTLVTVGKKKKVALSAGWVQRDRQPAGLDEYKAPVQLAFKHQTLSDDAIGEPGAMETNVVAWRDVW